jgi:hypothetical protein
MCFVVTDSLLQIDVSTSARIITIVGTVQMEDGWWWLTPTDKSNAIKTVINFLSFVKPLKTGTNYPPT